MVRFLSVNYVSPCEHCSNSQLWKLYFRWVYVVIISRSHVTGCMCVFVWVCWSLYVRARLWAGVCLCLHDSRPGREVTHEAAEGRELQTLHYCRGREGGGGRERQRQREQHRWDRAGKPQTDKRVRQKQIKKSNERSLSSLLLSTAGSLPHLCCRIHRKQMQTYSKSESATALAGWASTHLIMKCVYPPLTIKVVTQAFVCPELCLFQLWVNLPGCYPQTPSLWPQPTQIGEDLNFLGC